LRGRTKDRAAFVTDPAHDGIVLNMPTPNEPHSELTSSPPLGRARLSPELERELRRAAEEIERGEYVELSPEDLDRWADAGVAPWPDGSRG